MNTNSLDSIFKLYIANYTSDDKPSDVDESRFADFNRILTRIKDRRKSSNIKGHLIRQAQANKSNDSQVLLYNEACYWKMMYESEKMSRDSQPSFSISSKGYNILENIRIDIHNKESNNIYNYDSHVRKMRADLTRVQEFFDELLEELDDLKDSTGIKVDNWNRTFRDDVADKLTISTVSEYNKLIRNVERAIQTSEGVQTARLTAYKDDYLNNKWLSRFR